MINQCTQSLKNLEASLDEAEQQAAARTFDIGVQLTAQLAPDLQPLIDQVLSAR